MALPSGYVNNNNSLNNFRVYGGISEDELREKYEKIKKEENKKLRRFYKFCFFLSLVFFGISIFFGFKYGDISNAISEFIMFGPLPAALAFGIVSWAIYMDAIGLRADNVIFMLSIASKEVKSGVSLSKETTAASTNTTSAVTYYLLIDNYGDAFLCKDEALYNIIQPNVTYFVVMHKPTNYILSILEINS